MKILSYSILTSCNFFLEKGEWKTSHALPTGRSAGLSLVAIGNYVLSTGGYFLRDHYDSISQMSCNENGECSDWTDQGSFSGARAYHVATMVPQSAVDCF